MSGRTLVDTLDAKKDYAMARLKEIEADPSKCITDRVLVELLLEIYNLNRVTGMLDPERLTEIDHGEYQGTRVFVFTDKDYQPCDYYYIMWGYGSCSGCDAIESALCNTPDFKPNFDELYKCLHDLASSARKMNHGDEVL